MSREEYTQGKNAEISKHNRKKFRKLLGKQAVQAGKQNRPNLANFRHVVPKEDTLPKDDTALLFDPDRTASEGIELGLIALLNNDATSVGSVPVLNTEAGSINETGYVPGDLLNALKNKALSIAADSSTLLK